MRLTLLVPELIWPEPADQLALGKLSLPGLEWLLAHGRFSAGPHQAFEITLSEQFCLAEPSFGPLRLHGESNAPAAGNGHWLCADPVHLRFHHERIILADAGAFDLDEGEAQELVSALNQEFVDVGQFHVANPRRWYLRLNAAVDHQSEPISAVAGRLVDGEISDKNSLLTRWLNEVQMFLHSHPVNAQRQNEGKPAINSLWLWGGGRLPALPTPEHNAIRTDHPLAVGLGRASQAHVAPLPANLEELLNQAASGSSQLVVLDALLPKVLYEDSEGWCTHIQELEAHWFDPLKSAFGGKITELTLIAPTIYGKLCWTLRGKDHWKFWRKPCPLAVLAGQLATPATEGNS